MNPAFYLILVFVSAIATGLHYSNMLLIQTVMLFGMFLLKTSKRWKEMDKK